MTPPLLSSLVGNEALAEVELSKDVATPYPVFVASMTKMWEPTMGAWPPKLLPWMVPRPEVEGVGSMSLTVLAMPQPSEGCRGEEAKRDDKDLRKALMRRHGFPSH